MKRSRARKDRVRRTVPFLPNFVTTMSLFAGFYAIYFSLEGNYYVAAILIVMSGLIDGMDGRIARATNSTSAFGKEYDSLSDLTAFGVSPAVLLYLWKLQAFDRFGFLACCLYVACGALRLARFNSDTSGKMDTFTGLPIPMAALSIVSLVFLGKVVGDISALPVLIGTYLLSYLMVSNIRYPSFKHIDYIKTHPFQLLVAGLLVLVVVASAPEVMFFVLIMSFVVGGALWNLISYARMHAKEAKGKEDEKVTGENHNI